MIATRRARIAVVCFLLTGLAACDRQYDSNDFLPSAPGFQSALQITNVGNISVPADGFSTVKIEAQISPDANVSRTVRFETTLGGWVETTATGTSAQRAGGPVPDGRAVDPPPKMVTREADSSGKAAAFLQSTKTEGTALVTVSVAQKDGKILVSETREVAFTLVTGALSLTVSPDETFADGVSVIQLVAQISADSPSTFNTVTFSTTLGSLNEEAVTGGKSADVDVPADGNRIARARLTSGTAGTATVSAVIKDYPAAAVTQLATFSGQNPNSIQISTSLAQLPADETSQLTVTATIDPALVNSTALTDNEVKFTTTDGTLDGGTAKEATKKFGASNQATVLLKSGSAINPSVQLTATIVLSGGAQSASTTIAFVEVPKGEISVVPTSLNFVDVPVSSVTDLNLTIGNHGTADLTVQPPAFDKKNEGFSLFPAVVAPFTIPPNLSQVITVRFEAPATATTTPKSDTLKIMSDGGNLDVGVTGTAVVPPGNISTDPTSLDFGTDVVTTGTSAAQVLTVQNTGAGALSVTNITVTTFEATVSATSFTIPAGGTTPVTVTFAPTITTVQNGVLTIASSDPQDPALAINLTGKAKAP